MDESQLKSLLQRELSNAMGIGLGVLSTDRKKTLDYYKGKAINDLAPSGVPGRSNVVSTDVFDTVEWLLPSLIKMFMQQKSIAEFSSKTEEFEQAAKQAEEYVGNHIFFTQNDGFNILQEAFKDALISKNGFIKVYWGESEQEGKETYDGIGEIELQMLMDSGVNIVSIKQLPEEANVLNESLAHGGDQGVASSGDQFGAGQTTGQTTYRVVCKPKSKGQVKIEVIPPEDMRIHPKAKDCDSARFIAQRFERTILELREMGFDVPDDLTGNTDADSGEEKWARNEYGQFDYSNENEDDPALRTVTGWECYIRIDHDGDGDAELRKMTLVGDLLLDNVEVTQSPFVDIKPILVPHQFYGISPAELAMESQKTKTALMRAIIDSVNQGVNGRLGAVEDGVNLADLLNMKHVVRMKRPDAVVQLPTGTGDTAGAIAMLGTVDAAKESRTGFTQYSMGGDSPLISQTATGANIMTNRADARIDLIGRNFANGIKKMVWKILHLVTSYQDEPQRIKLGDKWAEISPTEWRDQFNLEVTVGLGTSNKQETMANLQLLQQAMGAAAQAGVVKPGNVFNAGIKLAETLGFTVPEKYFTSPEQEPDPQLTQQIQELQGQLEQGQAMFDQVKQERDAFFLQTQNKLEELELKKKELEIKDKELYVKGMQAKAAILEAQQELRLKREIAGVSHLQKQQELDAKETPMKHMMGNGMVMYD